MKLDWSILKNIKTNEIIFTIVFFKIYPKILKKKRFFKLLLKRIKNICIKLKKGGYKSVLYGPGRIKKKNKA